MEHTPKPLLQLIKFAKATVIMAAATFHSKVEVAVATSAGPETPGAPSACQPREGRVDTRALKEFVFSKYPKDSAIYEVSVTGKDFLDMSKFLAKVSIWLKMEILLRLIRMKSDKSYRKIPRSWTMNFQAFRQQSKSA